MTNVIEADHLGKHYRGTWALRECSLAIPAGHVAALVGPNGAGKSTLLNLAEPSAGGVTVLGGLPAGSRAAVDGIAFVAQDTPLYKNLSVADMLHLTRNLSRRFDQACAGPAGRAGHPGGAEGREAVRRPPGEARADPGAGPPAAAAVGEDRRKAAGGDGKVRGRTVIKPPTASGELRGNWETAGQVGEPWLDGVIAGLADEVPVTGGGIRPDRRRSGRHRT